MVDPRTQYVALRRVLARDQQRAKLDLENGDARDEEARRGLCVSPGDDIAMSFVRPISIRK